MEQNHETLPLARALREWLPPSRTGGATNCATAWRWAVKGARTPNGGRAFLRLTRIGGRLYLERAAVEDFKAACSGSPPAAEPAPAAPSPAPVPGQAVAVEVLERAGILPAGGAATQARLDRPADKPRRGRGRERR